MRPKTEPTADSADSADKDSYDWFYPRQSARSGALPPARGEAALRLTETPGAIKILRMDAEALEPGAPQTIIFARVREYLSRTPFLPFRIVTTSGRSYEVPTADHAVLFPMLRMIYIADDKGGQADIHALHVASIELLRRRRRAA